MLYSPWHVTHRPQHLTRITEFPFPVQHNSDYAVGMTCILYSDKIAAKQIHAIYFNDAQIRPNPEKLELICRKEH